MLTWIKRRLRARRDNARMKSHAGSASMTCAGKRGSGRRAIGIVVLFSVLWTQFAVASYACPAMLAGMGSGTSSSAMQPMDDCDGMRVVPALVDPDNPNLCHQHSQQGNQNADHGQPSPPEYSPALVIRIDGDPMPPLATLRQALARNLDRSSGPPKAIAHCCFRI